MAITRVKVTERVAYPADKVWDYIGAFNGLPKTMRGLVTSSEFSRVSNVRRLKISGVRKQLSERLIRHDNVARVQTYEIVEETNTPVPMTNYTSTIKVKPISSRSCIVEWSSSFKPKRGVTKAECIDFVTGVYKTGIEGTRRALSSENSKSKNKVASSKRKTKMAKAPAKKKKTAAKRKPAAKKAPAKKKTAAKRKPAAKKAPAKKKTAAKRKPAAKKAPAKKKTAAKRKPAAKKAPAKRKTAAKRKPAKKAPAKRKTAAKRKPARKAPAKRKTAAKRKR